MMRVTTHCEAGTDGKNEDWISATQDLVVVLDGGTVRTATGCRHTVAWYTAQLGSAVCELASDADLTLTEVLRSAIQRVSEQHSECDLAHPGTPSAAVAILRKNGRYLEYLVLGDVAVALHNRNAIRTIVDDRVDRTAEPERSMAATYPIGSKEKQEALLRMKHAELAARNRPGGYWIAAANPEAVTEALTGSVPLDHIQRIVVATDGGARIVSLFGLMSWAELFELVDTIGPKGAIERIRSFESSDPEGHRWPRNKCSDDATIAYIKLSDND